MDATWSDDWEVVPLHSLDEIADFHDPFFRSRDSDVNCLDKDLPPPAATAEKLPDQKFSVSPVCNTLPPPSSRLTARTRIAEDCQGREEAKTVQEGVKLCQQEIPETALREPYHGLEIPVPLTPQPHNSVDKGFTHAKVEHLELTNYGDLPYVSIRPLGQGGYGAIDEVKASNGQLFARKTLKRRLHEDFESIKLQFHNEVNILRNLQPRRHIINVVASYACGEDLAIILEPVADSGSLDAFLAHIRNSKSSARPSENDWKVLQKSFGCLTNALAYIHRKLVRHKDISTANILVHGGRLLFSDFGIALDCSNHPDNHTTTTGEPGPANRRFSAPEVLSVRGARTRKSDVFSLGCVFCDIISHLGKDSMLSLDKGDRYSDKADALIIHLRNRSRTPSWDRPRIPQLVYELTSQMMGKDAASRPSSKQAFRNLMIERSIFCEGCLSEDCIADASLQMPANHSKVTQVRSTRATRTMTAPKEDSKKLRQQTPVSTGDGIRLPSSLVQVQSSNCGELPASVKRAIVRTGASQGPSEIYTPFDIQARLSMVTQSEWIKASILLDKVLRPSIHEDYTKQLRSIIRRIVHHKNALELYYLFEDKFKVTVKDKIEKIPLISGPIVGWQERHLVFCTWLVEAWKNYHSRIQVVAANALYLENFLVNYVSSLIGGELENFDRSRFVSIYGAGATVFRTLVFGLFDDYLLPEFSYELREGVGSFHQFGAGASFCQLAAEASDAIRQIKWASLGYPTKMSPITTTPNDTSIAMIPSTRAKTELW